MIKVAWIGILIVVTTLELFAAASIVYSIQSDGHEHITVDIQNGSDRVLILHSFVIIFHLESEKSMEHVTCKGDCRLLPATSKRFGPFSQPAGTTQVEVSDIEYSTEL